MTSNRIAGLLLLAAITLASWNVLTSVTAPDSPARTGSSPDAVEVVHAFYEGMDAYLSSGDERFLELLAPGFQQFTGTDDPPGTASTLLAQLDVIRAANAPVRFSIVDLQDLGDIVIVRVAAEPGDLWNVAGLTIWPAVPPIGVEYLQMQRHTIVARWSQDANIPVVSRLLDETVSIGHGDQTTFGMKRITMEPGGSFPISDSASFGLLVEDGAVTLHAGGMVRRFDAGQNEWFAPGDARSLTNLSEEPCVFWLVSMGLIHPDFRGSVGMIVPPKQRQITIESMVWSVSYDWPNHPEQLRVRIARVTLPPSSLLQAMDRDIEQDLAVVEGALDVSVAQGVIHQRGPIRDSAPVVDSTSLTSGQGVTAAPGTLLTYRVSGPPSTTLLVLTVAAA